MARLEFVFSLFGFAATSAYWLAAAFSVTPAQFGEIAKFQAVVMLVVGSLSLRTYDLSFFLLRQHGQSQDSAFRLAFAVELGLATLSLVCIWGVLALVPGGVNGVATFEGLTALPIGFLAALPILQGSTQALLRQKNRDFHIALTDLVSGLAFALATGIVIFWTGRPDLIILSWLGAAAVRPLSLTLMSLGHVRSTGAGEAMSAASMPGWKIIAKFLALGQLTNVVKNNGPSIELLVLSTFVGSAAVAVFRVARSFLQLSTVLINIVYQRAFRGLAALGPNDDRGPLTRRINRNSLLAWLASLPLVALGALGFVYLNPNPDYGDLLTALPILALATLPTALQQAQFADLAISGRYVAINLCYMAGMAVLIGLCFFSSSQLSVQLFASWLLAANLTRLTLMYMLLRATRPTA